VQFLAFPPFYRQIVQKTRTPARNVEDVREKSGNGDQFLMVFMVKKLSPFFVKEKLRWQDSLDTPILIGFK